MKRSSILETGGFLGAAYKGRDRLSEYEEPKSTTNKKNSKS
jgi:hypothetical protein